MYIKINNRKIHYKKFGKGKPIIFAHGWGGNLYSLLNLAKYASSQYTSIVIDLPGFGKSDNPPPEWGIEGYAECIKEFINTMQLKKPHFFGHSFGGAIGIYLTSHHLIDVERLILCNSSFKREKKISKTAKLLKQVPKDRGVIFKILYPHAKKLYYQLFHRNSDLIKYPHLEPNFRKIVTEDLTNDVKNINTKTLILWGEDDTYTPVLWAYELKKNIQNSQLIVFPKTRHNLPLKHPDLVWNKIEPFIAT